MIGSVYGLIFGMLILVIISLLIARKMAKTERKWNTFFVKLLLVYLTVLKTRPTITYAVKLSNQQRNYIAFASVTFFNFIGLLVCLLKRVYLCIQDTDLHYCTILNIINSYNKRLKNGTKTWRN